MSNPWLAFLLQRLRDDGEVEETEDATTEATGSQSRSIQHPHAHTEDTGGGQSGSQSRSIQHGQSGSMSIQHSQTHTEPPIDPQNGKQPPVDKQPEDDTGGGHHPSKAPLASVHYASLPTTIECFVVQRRPLYTDYEIEEMIKVLNVCASEQVTPPSEPDEAGNGKEAASKPVSRSRAPMSAALRKMIEDSQQAAKNLKGVRASS